MYNRLAAAYKSRVARQPREDESLASNDVSPRSLDSSLFQQIGDRATSLDERIVAEIRSLIDSGRIAPGDRLPSERDLARALKVSRASLREALRRLSAVGLVEIRWGQGVFVRSADLDFLLERVAPLLLRRGNTEDLYEVRRLLEVEGAGWAADRGTRAERAELQALMTEAAANLDRLATDAAFARELDERYHNLVAGLSHNRVLMRIMVGLLDLLAEVRQRSFDVPGRALRSMDEHQRITAAIVAGDAPAARRAMLAHLRNAEAAVRGASHDG